MALATRNKKATQTLTAPSPPQTPRSHSQSQSAAARYDAADVSRDGRAMSDALMLLQAAAGDI